MQRQKCMGVEEHHLKQVDQHSRVIEEDVGVDGIHVLGEVGTEDGVDLVVPHLRVGWWGRKVMCMLEMWRLKSLVEGVNTKRAH
jgi:hypothetical protein